MHARYRVDCSPLILHLYYKYSILPFYVRIPLFYVCAKYVEIRNIYLSDILPTSTTQELLFGKEIDTDNEIEALFLKVHNFISTSKRFITVNIDPIN